MSTFEIQVAVIIALLGMVLVTALYTLRKMQAKQRACKALAQKLRVSYTDFTRTFKSQFPEVIFFKQGASSKASNFLFGKIKDKKTGLTDFEYSNSEDGRATSNSSISHSQTICFIFDDSIDLPKIYLRKTSFSTKLEKVIGMCPPINFSEDPEFSKMFIVQGPDQTNIKKLLNRKLREWFSAFKKDKIEFDCANNYILFHLGKILSAEKYPELLTKTFELLELIKATYEPENLN